MKFFTHPVSMNKQLDKIAALDKLGYKWDKTMSLQAAGVVMRKGEDIWFFGLDGSITHNPKRYR